MKLSKKHLFVSAIALLFISSNANSHSNISRPDGHAPIGVMRDHSHNKGEVMFSYRFGYMKSKGLMRGSNNVSIDEGTNKYRMVPRDMVMKMHMLGVMYGVTNNFTIAASGSVIEKEMHMINRNNQILRRETAGFGDTKIQAMYKLYNKNDNYLQFNLGVSLPTGDIKQDFQGTRLAYRPQVGSGSYALLPGLSYTSWFDSYSFGAQANGTFRLNTNNVGYKLGDTYNFTTWAAKKLDDSFSISSRLNYTIDEGIEGSDPTLNLMMSPVNDSSISARKKLDLLFGVNFIVSKGSLKGHRLAFEFGKPIYQYTDGIQPRADYNFTIGWQKTF